MKRYSPPKKEFLMLPNSVFDMPLDVYAFKIYSGCEMAYILDRIKEQNGIH